ncbi:MAG: hypothetical protein PHQ40_01260 [Anaerolineaceae bacterium]|nr:hypothetical protein [Anaerolineaceae bacterium]
MTPFEPSGNPGLPAPEVRMTELRIEPWPDGNRIRVHLNLTPFETRPSVELTVFDPGGEEVANAIILETMLPRIVVTLHLRPAESGMEYRLQASLFYEDLGVIQRLEQSFSLPSPEYHLS